MDNKNQKYFMNKSIAKNLCWIFIISTGVLAFFLYLFNGFAWSFDHAFIYQPIMQKLPQPPQLLQVSQEGEPGCQLISYCVTDMARDELVNFYNNELPQVDWTLLVQEEEEKFQETNLLFTQERAYWFTKRSYWLAIKINSCSMQENRECSHNTYVDIILSKDRQCVESPGL